MDLPRYFKPTRIIIYHYHGGSAHMLYGRVRRTSYDAAWWTPRYTDRLRSMEKITRAVVDYIEHHPERMEKRPDGWTVVIPGNMVP